MGEYNEAGLKSLFNIDTLGSLKEDVFSKGLTRTAEQAAQDLGGATGGQAEDNSDMEILVEQLKDKSHLHNEPPAAAMSDRDGTTETDAAPPNPKVTDLLPTISAEAARYTKKILGNNQDFTSAQKSTIAQMLDGFAISCLGLYGEREHKLAQDNIDLMTAVLKGVVESVNSLNESSSRNEGSLLSIQREIKKQGKKDEDIQKAEHDLSFCQSIFSMGMLIGGIVQNEYPTIGVTTRPQLRAMFTGAVVQNASVPNKKEAIAACLTLGETLGKDWTDPAE